MNFPRLKDTAFPNLDTVNVYEFQNTFDYTRWDEGTRVKLCNVLWSNNYLDVVKFDTNANRDNYFDTLQDVYEIEIETQARMVPDGSIKIPIPYDVAARYNYLFIDLPLATGETNYIDYETAKGVRRWYFFIDTILFKAPNTTQVSLIPDVWTNFQNDVTINYMVLERGHAPVAATNVDTYLKNPINNSAYLLAPDVNFGSRNKVANADFIPVANGVKYLCLVSTCKPSDLSALGSGSAISSEWSAPTYYNTSDRWGYQYGVNGYSFGDGYDYSGTRTIASGGANSGLANNVCVYAIRCSYAYDSTNSRLATLIEKCPSFINTIQAAFVVDANYISLGTSYTVGGVTLYSVATNLNENTLKNISLNKSMFGYPKSISKYAKLYTSPYATLEISDNTGTVYEFNIEDCGKLSIDLLTSTAFPTLAYRVVIDGIGGNKNLSYVWRRIDGTLVNKIMYGSDWDKFSFEWEIPTYALYLDPKTAYQMRNANRVLTNARRMALVGYENSVRDANTAKENADALADTARQNVADSMTCLQANNVNSCNTNTANAELTTATNTENYTIANDIATGLTNMSVDLNSTTTAWTNYCNIQTTEVENEVSIATTTNTAQASIQTAAMSGATSMAMQGAQIGAAIGAAAGPMGMGIGAVVGGVSGVFVGGCTAQINADMSKNNASLVAQANVDVTTKTCELNSTIAEETNENSLNNTFFMNQQLAEQTENNNDLLESHTTNNNTCATNNTNNTANTHNGCAERTRTTSKSNALETREAAVLDSKNILENAQNLAYASVADGGNERPIEYGKYSGTANMDAFETRGISVRVRTQNDDSIMQAGSMFVRYGYALNQIWDVNESGLKLMNYFTYWKASDIWIDDRLSSTNSVANTIARIFLNGVTVWNEPEDIGRIDPYGN